MLNQVVLVGRIAKDLELEENGENKNAILILATQRSFKNENGEYDTDFIPCRLYNLVAEKTLEYCKQGDVVGIKGRIQMVNDEIGIVAEKVTFLSSESN